MSCEETPSSGKSHAINHLLQVKSLAKPTLSDGFRTNKLTQIWNIAHVWLVNLLKEVIFRSLRIDKSLHPLITIDHYWTLETPGTSRQLWKIAIEIVKQSFFPLKQVDLSSSLCWFTRWQYTMGFSSCTIESPVESNNATLTDVATCFQQRSRVSINSVSCRRIRQETQLCRPTRWWYT